MNECSTSNVLIHGSFIFKACNSVFTFSKQHPSCLMNLAILAIIASLNLLIKIVLLIAWPACASIAEMADSWKPEVEAVLEALVGSPRIAKVDTVR